jgi:small subunit ribosomal protein S15e
MADAQQADGGARKRSFKKFSFRGVDLKDLLELKVEDLSELVHARARRRLKHGLKSKPMGLMKKLRAAKLAAGPNEKPAVVKTHLRNMIVVPEMIGSVVGVYNGKVFNQVEVKPEMVGHYLGEFSITYRPVAHKRPGAGATSSSRFIPLK